MFDQGIAYINTAERSLPAKFQFLHYTRVSSTLLHLSHKFILIAYKLFFTIHEVRKYVY